MRILGFLRRSALTRTSWIRQSSPVGGVEVVQCMHSCRRNANFVGFGVKSERMCDLKKVNFVGFGIKSEKVWSYRSCCTQAVRVKCWRCKHPLQDSPVFFCSACKVVQPPGDGASFFNILSCDVSFAVDTKALQRRYLQLQRSLHPDNFSQKSVEEQEYSQHQSALVNKAYKTLLKPLSRGLYMLELEGMRIDDGTESGADADLLMELMEINEALAEARTAEEADKISRDTKGKLSVLTEKIDAALRAGELHAAKALLAQMKYFSNIEDKVKEKLSDLM
ncbi:LOW QUALITY PROTEIN: iron-sulfur cluster co-chaperone protein HscB [Nerophis ophidion]|uniref:LOW QUALITY PROTEIN: iron-sulfur cluster co-chaperone protein HscB n=1 Tax=Nerophis ophidion TaxID=159077 RepID=UPI002ADFFFFE|nr:LOW QUALITY PROTEIN: iron-sulfur cluster co-chaperone protein HscB [Nerophis ophidion]